MTALLAARDASIRREGTTLVSGLTMEIGGPEVGLFGRDRSALFRLLSGEAELSSGSLEILGRKAASAVREGYVGLGLSAVTLPPEMRVRELFAARARLAGMGFFAARRAAKEVTRKLGIPTLSKKRLGSVNETERRAAIVASATVTEPAVLALEEPFAGLDDEAATSLRELIRRASAGRSLIVSAASDSAMGVEAAFFASFPAVAVLEGGRVEVGAPGSLLHASPRFAVWAAHSAPRLSEALARRGLPAELEGAPDPGGGGRLVVSLPEGSDTSPILDAALEVSVPILELVPFGVRAGRT